MNMGLKIDTNRCMGCCACEIACKMEHKLPVGIRFIVMHQEEDNTPGKEKLFFHFSLCNHCEDAACMEVCPVQAIYKNEDGIILVKEDSCIGCKKCREACPDQIPQFGADNIMRKCDLCVSRLEKGMKPSCMLACPANVITL